MRFFVGLGGFFCWCPKNPGIRTKERAYIYNPILGIGFGTINPTKIGRGLDSLGWIFLED